MSGGVAISACPACAAAPLATETARRGAGRGALMGDADSQILLALPGIHCAACISTVERALGTVPGVRAARVNLTLRRATVEAPGLEAAPLVAAVEAAGYEAHELDAATLARSEDTAGRDLLMRLAVAGFAMMNVMLLSVAVWSGASDATRDLFHWISAAIALPTLAFSAQPFFVSAVRVLRVGRLNMDVPISLALLLAAGMSLYETTQHGAHAYFDAALSLTFFLLAGRLLDARMRRAARSAAAELSALEVPRARRVDAAGQEALVAIADLAPGDLIRVRPGDRLAADGVIESGTTDLDRAFLTGESLPVAAGPGDAVHAGEVALSGVVTLRITALGPDTALGRIRDLVARAETARMRYTPLADRAAAIYAPAVHLLAAAAFLGWLWASGDVRLSLNIAVAVLIITCPCALGLAVPAVATAATGRLYRHGLLVKSDTALERLATIDTVIFDKTGTLTDGRPDPVGLDALPARDLGIARALAEASSHPLARALGRAIAARGIAPAELGDLREEPGRGVAGSGGARLGRADWVGATRVDGTATYLGTGHGAPVAIRFSETLRPGAAEAVATLRARGVAVRLCSGDVAAAVAEVAARAGIDDWEAGLDPEAKAARVADLTQAGRQVLMVGDGLNDTAALAAARASISPASALDAARVVSDAVLIGGTLEEIPAALATARSATRRIVENFGVAAAYNAVAIPVALAGLATPLAAALAMSFSSITVSINALRLR
ncbi:heavy metal translocating P-type ATPase [Mesobaculum littorinae]|uniref:Heavy metal translocating P-type ATPase n=1 Tax=Mesobaculum littorinae TaxID=2486419 RepID=A0A438ADD3_9RHOB|nr:heavy metal translocating P-type ATPase [Mesobaculum littorinae]RVV96701.1 heavy metal translocating P-type ATPase [Mesobaculum littorinae]